MADTNPTPTHLALLKESGEVLYLLLIAENLTEDWALAEGLLKKLEDGGYCPKREA